MNQIKVAAAVLNQTPLDWDQNKFNILQALEIALRRNVAIICLPELCIPGYGCEDAYHSSGLLKMAWQVLQEVLPATKGLIVCLGLPIVHQNSIFDAACLIADRKILGFTAKQYLAGDGIHYEPRWFKPWPKDVRADVEIDGRSYPIGDLYYDVGDIRLGLEICEDAWVAHRPGGELALRGVDIILNPSASHFAFGKHEIRKRFVIEGSRAFHVSYVYANLLGCDAGRIIYPGGSLIASGGMLIAAGPRLTFDDVLVTTAVIDVDATRLDKWRTGSFQPDLLHHTGRIVYKDFSYPSPDEPLSEIPFIRPLPIDFKQEEFTHAVALGLFDYLRKSRSHGFVVSLSGGCDSSAVACLVALMVKFGIASLGMEKFLGKLSYIKKIQAAKNEKEIIRDLLTCAYQATENSGPITLNAAKKLAKELGAEFYEFNVDPMVNQYLQMVAAGLRRKLSWQTDDLALQNIQARVRGPGIWLLTNIKRALLLTTSNRSEAAVGYATMDGDTCGGLCPIGGIDKAFLREWLHWLQTEGPKDTGPIPILSLVTEQRPTAELRPPADHQTDEDDLMPYPILDAIEGAAIRDKKMPLEVFQLIRVGFGQKYSVGELSCWVERFFKLWCYNQWKRERYAPSFHLDDKNLDPKTWCRFPILSGNFERELAELREFVKGIDQPKP